MLAPAVKRKETQKVMGTEFSLEREFWRAFTKSYWNRKPVLIRAPFPKPIATPDDVFRGVVATRRRLGSERDDLDLSLEGRKIVLDLDRWLPCAKDLSLTGYQSRLKRDGVPGQLAMLVNEFQSELGWTFYDRIRQFLHGLYEIVGVPARAEVDLFMGNYKRTPLGVHRDEAHVFVFVVEGRKQFRLWPKQAFQSISHRYGPGPYTKYMKGSICLTGDPGDILFWPSSYWHVAESDGQPGSSLTLGLYHGYSVFVALMKNLRQWYHTIAGDDRDPIGSLPFPNSQVPEEMSSIARRAEGRPGALTERLMRSWMETITGYGFERIPRPPGGASLRNSKGVRGNPISPILHWKFNGSLMISANGRSIVVPNHRGIEKMLGKLSHGLVCEMGDSLAQGNGKSRRASRRALRQTLDFLLEERALEPVQ
jgi:50S ribosomal protein L16 3-hydroxylase